MYQKKSSTGAPAGCVGALVRLTGYVALVICFCVAAWVVAQTDNSLLAAGLASALTLAVTLILRR